MSAEPQRSGPAASAAMCGLAWIDVSTGRFQAGSFTQRELADGLARIAPVEILVADDAEHLPPLPDTAATTTRPAWAFALQAAHEALAKHFGTQSLEGFGFDDELPDDRAAIRAAGAILDYLGETQKSTQGHVDRLLRFSAGTTLEIDPATRRSLEITETIRTGRREGSLLGVTDRTVTAMGARLLAEWLAAPLADVEGINRRLDAVGELVDDASLADSLRERLRAIYDVERLLARVSTGRASPRDLSFVARTLGCLPKVKARLAGRKSELLVDIDRRLDLCPDIRSRLESALEDDCPLATRDGGFIRLGYHDPLDQLRELQAGGKQWMAQYQAAEVERTGIANLKVGFNRVFGYYLEVTHAHRDKVPGDYIRKQTLKNAERFITPELKEYEEKVLTADERAKELEYELFVELRDEVARAAGRLRTTAQALAEVDVLASLAELARSRNYVRPQVVDEPVLDIEAGRHPVLDVTEPEGTFVPNGVAVRGQGPGDRRQGSGDDVRPSLLLITGPNMAGKSTYIRQAALLTLLAQIGSFVPARRATVGVADRIFARVGASDELSRGQSTFMVEMTETARILHTATRRSLVILDEIGRGTSTYDGLSLAWSIVEHLHDRIGCRTLFATHYHELTELEEQLAGVQNWNVAVREWQDQVVFLHQVVEGAADKSYGIHVAQLAGVPPEVNERAQEVLARLEARHVRNGQHELPPKPHARPSGEQQLALFDRGEHPLIEALRTTKLEEMTPLEAIECLAKWQRELGTE